LELKKKEEIQVFSMAQEQVERTMKEQQKQIKVLKENIGKLELKKQELMAAVETAVLPLSKQSNLELTLEELEAKLGSLTVKRSEVESNLTFLKGFLS
jgi:chromosome segregation ATPase